MRKLARHFAAIVLPAMFFISPALVNAQEASTSSDESAIVSDRPTVPADASSWAGPMVIIICAMFLMAWVIGPSVRAEMVEPPHASHDDHGHGDDHAHDAHGHH